VIDELRELHPEREIVANIQPGISLLCDTARLSQLLSNLLKNAIVHGRPDAPVTVSVTSSDAEFAIAVCNQGDPLSPQVIQQLFKPFWRAQPRAAHEGLGLGLYIVSQVAMSHGGKLDVTSHDGTICFKFSMAAQSANARPVTI
jgi:signal transduction histidine kinase